MADAFVDHPGVQICAQAFIPFVVVVCVWVVVFFYAESLILRFS